MFKRLRSHRLARTKPTAPGPRTHLETKTVSIFKRTNSVISLSLRLSSLRRLKRTLLRNELRRESIKSVPSQPTSRLQRPLKDEQPAQRQLITHSKKAMKLLILTYKTIVPYLQTHVRPISRKHKRIWTRKREKIR